MTARFLIGDVFDRMAELPDHSFDLITCSPPFLALRSYLPDNHPDKAKEIGSEPTPAVFIDTMLALAAEWRRLLAPHGSIAIEIGDTYAGSGGAGGDYGPDGLREGQPTFRQRKTLAFADGKSPGKSSDALRYRNDENGGLGWPMEKSLCGIPHLFTWSLAYGRNLLTGQPSPAGQWRIRNVKPWIRTNPPVGALGDKERPATSYITVACVARDRYFDLDAVRTANPRVDEDPGGYRMVHGKPTHDADPRSQNPAGAPPRDWWHTVDATLDTELDTNPDATGHDLAAALTRAGILPNPLTIAAILDAELDARAGRLSTNNPQKPGDPMTPGRLGSGDGTNNDGKGRYTLGEHSVGARGHHLRRALERAGILTTLDAYDISPKGYAGAHYAVWPPELVRLLVDEMCPRRVCTQCGEPSRRITGEAEYVDHSGRPIDPADGWRTGRGGDVLGMSGGKTPGRRVANTVGWSDCGHNTWRPGRILDPFAGTATTLAVATGMGRDAVGIDIDERNALLASERVGMFLEVEDRPTEKEAS